MGDAPKFTVDAQPFSAAAWAPFGWVPVPDTDTADGTHTLHFEWADPHLNTIHHRADEVPHTDRGLVCTVMYHHVTHTQALMPLDARAVIAVAPASVAFSRPDDLDEIRAFVVEPGDVFVLHQGTWHWGPFPIEAAPVVRLLNVQGRRYAEDNTSVDLPARAGSVVEVVVPHSG